MLHVIFPCAHAKAPLIFTESTCTIRDHQTAKQVSHLWKCTTLGQWLEVYLRVIVCEDPGEDGVLHQVIVGSSSQGVQVHQILEVADFTSLRKDNRHILEW